MQTRTFRKLDLYLGLLFCVSCFGNKSTELGIEQDYSGTESVNQNWTLSWQDEFDRWNAQNWNYDLGNYLPNTNVRGWGNNELQNYTKRNAFVQDGILIIRAIKEQSQDDRGFTHLYSSGRLKSAYSQTYGKIEVRARFPIGNGTLGKGIWPAIWMLPKNNDYGGWAASGEIDIFEARGSQPEVAIGSIHFGGEWPNNRHKSEEYNFPSGTSIMDWHIYSIIWSPQSISWYIDNTPYAHQDSWDSAAAPFPAPFDKDFYLILNLAVGGHFDGEPDGNTRFPAEMQVDYVRFYRESD